MVLKTFCLSILLPFVCFAENPYIPRSAEPVLEPWRWREMPELSGHGIRCMDEARDGTLWFGGIGGVLQYDGLRIKWMPFDDDLKSDIGFKLSRDLWCAAMLCMPDGSLLAVVESALLQWKDGAWSILLEGLGVAEYETRLVRADDGSVWLLRPNGLWYFNADISQQHVVVKAAAREWLNSFCLDANGDAWVVMTRPVAELIHIPLLDGRPLQKVQWSTYPVVGNISVRETSICAGPEGKIWYVDNSQNAVRSLDPRTREWHEVDHPNAGKGYFSLFKDRQDTLWAGGPGHLFSIKESEVTYFPSSKTGLPSVPVSIFEAENGWWWVIARGGYVYRMDPGNSQWWTYADLNFQCESMDGTQWFKTASNHVVAYDPEDDRWVLFLKGETQLGPIRSVYASSHGLVWAVGRHEGRAAFSVYDGKQWRCYSHPDFAMGIADSAVFEAADGTIWFGAVGDHLPGLPNAGGALQYEVKSGIPQLLKHYSSPNFPYAIVRFAQTADGTLWLGAPQIYSYKPLLNEKSNPVDDLPNVFTYDMVTDAKGELWVAKGLYGIFQKEGDEWRRYLEDGGLKGKMFVDLLPLPDGTLLVASDRGISRFDGQTWAGVFADDFGMSTRVESMRHSRDGSIWLNYRGRDSRSPRVNMNVDPAQISNTVRYMADTQQPDTFIASHPERVDSDGNINISWAGRDFWENTPVDQVQFSWRLDEGEWSPFVGETSYSFIGMKSGSHTFEVRARDRDFNIDPTPALSGFVVNLPVWQRPWFIAMFVTTVGGVASFLWLLIYSHEKRLKDRAAHLLEMNEMKSGFYTNVSHELNTPLHVVKRSLQVLDGPDSPHHDKSQMVKMALRNARRMEVLISQLLDFRKIEQKKMLVHPVEGDLTQHVRECVELYQPLIKIREIKCWYTCDESIRGWFDPDKLEKIISNLIGNAVKYTSAGGNVWVKLNGGEDERVGRAVSLIVEDDGRGVSSELLPRIYERFYRIPEKETTDGAGIGLNLTRELVDLWGGEIHAESPIHSDLDRPGTRFTVVLPIEIACIKNGDVDYEKDH